MERLPYRGLWGKDELSGDVMKKVLRRVSLTVGNLLCKLWGVGSVFLDI